MDGLKMVLFVRLTTHRIDLFRDKGLMPQLEFSFSLIYGRWKHKNCAEHLELKPRHVTQHLRQRGVFTKGFEPSLNFLYKFRGHACRTCLMPTLISSTQHSPATKAKHLLYCLHEQTCLKMTISMSVEPNRNPLFSFWKPGCLNCSLIRA